MISFTVKGKNFPPQAATWGPNGYYYVDSEMKWVEYTPAQWLSIGETAHFSDAPNEIGFWVFFRDASGEDVHDTMGAMANTF